MTECTFSCGHSLDFRASPPRKGELVWCQFCQKWVRVTDTRSTKRRAEDSPDGEDGGDDGSDE